MMRSESTSALGHPSETKLTFGAAACGMLDLSDCSARANANCSYLQGFEPACLVPLTAHRRNAERTLLSRAYARDPDVIVIDLENPRARTSWSRFSSSAAR